MEDSRFLPQPVSQTEHQRFNYSIQPVSRPAQVDVLPQSTFQSSQPPKINTATTPVRRKPVPNSASPSPVVVPKFFPSSGQLVAVGNEEKHDDAKPAQRPQESFVPSQRAWLQQEYLESPRLELRNLDEYYAHYIYIPHKGKRTSFTD